MKKATELNDSEQQKVTNFKLLKPHVEYLIAQCITQNNMEVKYMDKKAFQSVKNVYFSSFVFFLQSAWLMFQSVWDSWWANMSDRKYHITKQIQSDFMTISASSVCLTMNQALSQV